MVGKINYEVVPGTTHLVDIDSEHKKDSIVLVPTPSDDPNDPLNWSKARKWHLMFCIVVYTFGTGIPGTCIYSILTDIAAAPGVNITVGDLNAGTGYMFLFLGLGNLLLLPLAQQYGKRPVYLFSAFSCSLINVWQPFITTNGSWIGSKILNGFFVAPIEALPEVSISDVFFEHERATYMAVYGVALFGSNYMAPLVAGFINQGQDWKWVIYWSCIFCAVCFIYLALFMEETNYERKVRVKTDEDGNVITAITSQGEKIPMAIQSVKSITVNDNLANETVLVEGDSSDFETEYPPVKTFWQKLSLTSGIRKQNHLVEYLRGPFYMVQFPPVLWAGFLYGSSLFWYSVLNGTEATILGAEPYNFSSAMCGLAYVSPVIFVLIIYFYAGWSTDWIKIYIAKKHDGKSQAEDRLWVLAVYMILGPCALILWGVGAAHSIHWFGVVFGLGLMAGLCVIGCVSSVTYVIDCYQEMTAEAMAVAIVIRNTMNFAMDYGITPWLTNTGVQNTFIAAAFICLFCIGTFLLMVYTGYYWRNKTKGAYWKIIERRRSQGIYH
ncbi:hypothetical protein B5S33_g4210 [[Candida] boidinii]|nr:hypothetical protein B5S30_g3001 [[Candida] boidinii]OWB85541.1 hypothetical protein B5S33_g4210 [[Candida] boidinii]